MTNLSIVVVIGFIVIMSINQAYAQSVPHLPAGWLWYNSASKPQANSPHDNDALPRFSTATSALTFQQQLIHEAQAQAVMQPTPSNIRLYRSLQEYVFQQAARFGAVWQQVSLTDPALDFTTRHPSASAAQPILRRESLAQETAVIQTLKRQFILTYIYRGKRPIEATFEVTVNRFAHQQDWPLKEINVDDPTVSQQKGADVMQRWLAALQLPKTPALLLVDPKTQETFPLAFGFIAQEEIGKRCAVWLDQMRVTRGGGR